MARLIDADELLKDNTWEWFDDWGNYTLAGQSIADAPTVDAVEVVRCKDCQCGYFTRDGFYERIGCTVLNRKMRLTDYCVFGVKMDGGDKE